MKKLKDLHYSSENDDRQKENFNIDHIRWVDVYVSEENKHISIVFNHKEYHKKHNMFFDTIKELKYYYNKIKKSLKDLYSYPITVTATPLFFYNKLKKIEEMSVDDMILYIKNGSTYLADPITFTKSYDREYFDHTLLNLDENKLYQTYAKHIASVENNVVKLTIKTTRNTRLTGFKPLKEFKDTIVNDFLLKNKETLQELIKKYRIEYVQSILLHVYMIFDDLYSVDFEIRHL